MTSVARCLACDRPLALPLLLRGTRRAPRGARRFCNRACAGVWHGRQHQGRMHADPPPPPDAPLVFAGAQCEHLDDAPPRCTRCESPWAELDDGALACRICGLRFYVADLLRAAVARAGWRRASGMVVEPDHMVMLTPEERRRQPLTLLRGRA